MRLQRRASLQTRKGRCSTLNCCIILSLNRFRFKNHAVATAEKCPQVRRQYRCRRAANRSAASAGEIGDDGIEDQHAGRRAAQA
ncbi:hypothetical protein GFL28_07840 [Rhizobium leguminosarum bv. viciae]|uniref:Uncharacterized protein n=1 Tax=Rhizobium leguminosarum TaxID=384 RepID=A0A7M3DNG3_RHILE|nr:hypothetical protein [Rhizobium leguminosarum bv. viciae]TAY50204.1 hypothetical protein ELH90_00015 [Rhizobium leguminosarum]